MFLNIYTKFDMKNFYYLMTNKIMNIILKRQLLFNILLLLLYYIIII